MRRARCWGSPTQPTEVWIDDKGLIRRERLKMRMDVDGERVKGTLVVDFLDIGQPQAVELPDDDAVVDVTDEAADKLGGG